MSDAFIHCDLDAFKQSPDYLSEANVAIASAREVYSNFQSSLRNSNYFSHTNVGSTEYYALPTDMQNTGGIVSTNQGKAEYFLDQIAQVNNQIIDAEQLEVITSGLTEADQDFINATGADVATPDDSAAYNFWKDSALGKALNWIWDKIIEPIVATFVDIVMSALEAITNLVEDVIDLALLIVGDVVSALVWVYDQFAGTDYHTAVENWFKDIIAHDFSGSIWGAFYETGFGQWIRTNSFIPESWHDAIVGGLEWVGIGVLTVLTGGAGVALAFAKGAGGTAESQFAADPNASMFAVTVKSGIVGIIDAGLAYSMGNVIGTQVFNGPWTFAGGSNAFTTGLNTVANKVFNSRALAWAFGNGGYVRLGGQLYTAPTGIVTSLFTKLAGPIGTVAGKVIAPFGWKAAATSGLGKVLLGLGGGLVGTAAVGGAGILATAGIGAVDGLLGGNGGLVNTDNPFKVEFRDRTNPDGSPEIPGEDDDDDDDVNIDPEDKPEDDTGDEDGDTTPEDNPGGNETPDNNPGGNETPDNNPSGGYTPPGGNTTPDEPVTPVDPGETPGETPGEETPGEETPGEETPGEETPGEETPGEETPGEETPGEETPGEEDPNDGRFIITNVGPEWVEIPDDFVGSQTGGGYAPGAAGAYTEIPAAGGTENPVLIEEPEPEFNWSSAEPTVENPDLAYTSAEQEAHQVAANTLEFEAVQTGGNANVQTITSENFAKPVTNDQNIGGFDASMLGMGGLGVSAIGATTFATTNKKKADEEKLKESAEELESDDDEFNVI